MPCLMAQSVSLCLLNCMVKVYMWLMSFDVCQAQSLGTACKVGACAVAGLTCSVSSYIR